jgi:hypothetical protein
MEYQRPYELTPGGARPSDDPSRAIGARLAHEMRDTFEDTPDGTPDGPRDDPREVPVATEPTGDTGADRAAAADPPPGAPSQPAASRGGMRIVRADPRAAVPGGGTSADDAPAAHGSPAALRFVGRLALLDHEAVRDAVVAWRESMRDDASAWFAAEEAVARAVVTSGRHHEQRPLLIPLAEAFAYSVWYRGRPQLTLGESAPELRVHATEASGQYLGTLAMLALLVRDHLDAATFDLLYRPFAALIPAADLGRE